MDANNGTLTALATILLAGFTIILSFATIKAANAAMEAASVLPLLERPYVMISDMKAKTEAPSRALPTYPSVKITFHNYGRTPANIQKAVIRIKILDHIPGDADVLSEDKMVETGIERWEAEIIIGSDKSWGPDLRCENQLSISQDTKMGMGQMSLYCWGYIEYRDIFRHVHPTHFCRRYDGTRRTFEIVGGVDRNYAK